MDFTKLYTLTISKDESSLKLLTVSKCVFEDGNSRYFIDIRKYYKPKPSKDSTEEIDPELFKPTKSGVNLTPDEFRKVLPALIQGGDAVFECRERRLTVRPTAHPKVMRLLLEKTDNETK